MKAENTSIYLRHQQENIVIVDIKIMNIMNMKLAKNVVVDGINLTDCSKCVESFDFHNRIGEPIKHKTHYHLKYHTLIGEFVWLMLKQIPTTIKFAFTWSWFRTYCGELSFRDFLRPIAGWKLGWDIAYQCNEVW